MTTANLSVGINTSKAKTSLDALKKELASLGGSLNLTVNAKDLHGSVQSALSKEKFRIDVDADRLRKEISGTLKTLQGELKTTLQSAFNFEHQVKIDKEGLIRQVREAVTIGLTNSHAKITTSGPNHAAAAPIESAMTAGAGLGATLKTTMTQAIAPVMDELAKATAAISSGVKQADRESATGRSQKASIVRSFRQDDGSTIRHMVTVAPNDALAVIQRGRAGQNLADAIKGIADAKTEIEKLRMRSAPRLDPRTILGLPSRDEMKNVGAQLRAQMEGALAEASMKVKSAPKIDPRTILGLPSREEMSTLSAQLRAQMQGVLTEASLKAKSASRIDPRTILGLPSRDEMKGATSQLRAQMEGTLAESALKAKSAPKLDARTVLGLPSDAEMRTQSARLRAQMEAQAAEVVVAAKKLNAELRNIQASAMFDARRSGNYTAQGVRIAGAAAVMAHSPSTGAAFLNNDALVRSIPLLEQHRKALVETEPAAKRAASGHVALTKAMNDGHAAARGLAGSMGALWTTYGSIVPLVAAAAIGASLRKVFTVGKDVEYQLKFVSALADFTPVSTSKFADAVRGSMVAPTEAAEAMRGLAQNGLSVRESLQALPTILNLATAGEMSLAEAALSATGVMAAFGLSIGDLGHVSDVFVKAAAISNTSVREMTEAMKQASTVSDVYHVTIEETGAALAIMAQRNIRGTQAGTAYRNMWTELVTPSKKAQESLKAVNLTLFDGNHQLIESSKALDLLHGKLSTLNEQSRLTLLHDLFGKKGEKAANTLMNDYEEYLRMKEKITNESKDFSQSVVNALNETATGKLRQLFTEFELSSVASFERSSNSVRNFADSLRLIVGSEGFINGLNRITEAVANLTRYLVEHSGTILATIAIWKATGWTIAAYEGLKLIAKGAMAAESALIGLGVASRRLLTIGTGGLGLIAALGAEYFLLRDKTDAATEAQNAYNNSLDAESARLQRSTKDLEDRNKQLEIQLRYQRQGKSEMEARELADAELNKGKVKSAADLVSETETKRNHAQAELNALREKMKTRGSRDQTQISNRNAFAEAVDGGEIARELALIKEVEALNVTLEKQRRAFNNARLEAQERELFSTNDFATKRLDAIRKFNLDVENALKNDPRLKKKIGGLTIAEASAPTTKDAFDEYMKDQRAKLNAGLHNVVLPDRHSDVSRVTQILAQLRAEQNETKQTIRFRRELDEARFPEKLYGPNVAATLSEQRAEAETLRLMNLEQAAVDRLTDAKRELKGLSEADKTNIDTALQQYKEQLKLQQNALAHLRVMNALKADERQRELTFNAGQEAQKLGVGSDKRIEKIRQSYSTKVIDPASAAESNARLAEQEAYAERIAQHEGVRAELERQINVLWASSVEMRGEDLTRVVAVIEEAKRHLAFEKDILDTLKQQANTRANKAGSVARAEFEQSQTAEYGFQKFWQEFSSSADSSAKQVQDIMKSTTSNMGMMFKGFTETGKLDFKSFARSVAQTASQMLIDKAITQFLKIGMSFFGPSVGGGIGSATAADVAAAGPGLMFLANGGVMTSRGALPLHTYSGGGIANTPQLAMYGEGRKPEAYVPLPDGRSIPVTMKGAGGGDTHVSIAVHVDSNGRSQVESDGSGEKAHQLGQMIENMTMSLLVREKRAGGLLHAV